MATNLKKSRIKAIEGSISDVTLKPEDFVRSMYNEEVVYRAEIVDEALDPGDHLDIYYSPKTEASGIMLDDYVLGDGKVSVFAKAEVTENVVIDTIVFKHSFDITPSTSTIKLSALTDDGNQ